MKFPWESFHTSPGRKDVSPFGAEVRQEKKEKRTATNSGYVDLFGFIGKYLKSKIHLKFKYWSFVFAKVKHIFVCY